MKIAYDLLGCQSEGSWSRGIGRYSLSLGLAMQKEIARSDDELEVLAYAVDPADRILHLRQAFCQAQMHILHTPSPRGLWGDLSDPLRPAAAELAFDAYKCLQADVVYLSSVMEGFGREMSLPCEYRSLGKLVACTCYDFIPALWPERFLGGDQIRAWYGERLAAMKSCDLLFAISEATRQDAIKLLGVSAEHVVNIGSDVAETFKVRDVPDKGQLLSRYGIAGEFVMTVGAPYWHKNMEGLIKGYGRLSKEARKDCQLVVACKVDNQTRERWMALAGECGLGPEELVVTGFVPDDDLVSLYNLARLFVFPSFYEGFGLPVLEAMRCGAPVLGADNSSIREIIQKPEALFDEHDSESIAKAMEHCLLNDDFRRKLREWSARRQQDFSWAKSAKLVIDAIKRMQHNSAEHGTRNTEHGTRNTEFIMSVGRSMGRVACAPDDYLQVADCYIKNHAWLDSMNVKE